MRDLGTLGNYSVATGVNAAGQVVGNYYIANQQPNQQPNQQHAFITGPNGAGMTDLGALSGDYSYSVATGINDAGQMAGTFSTDAGVKHAFITGPNGVA